MLLGGTVSEEIADGSERQLDPQSVTVSRLGGAIGLAIFAAPSLVGTVAFIFFNTSGGWVGLVALAAWALLCAAAGVWVLWWPAVRYRHTFYRVSEQGIRIRRGALWRSVHVVPRSRVQHTDISQGPIERMFEVATLVIYTAGTEHASISLGGLPHEAAMRIRDHLIEGGLDDAV